MHVCIGPIDALVYAVYICIVHVCCVHLYCTCMLCIYVLCMCAVYNVHLYCTCMLCISIVGLHLCVCVSAFDMVKYQFVIFFLWRECFHVS